MNILYVFLLIIYCTESALYDSYANLYDEPLSDVKRDHLSDSAQYRRKRSGIASDSECGQYSVRSQFLTKIVGGEEAIAHSYPFHVGILMKRRLVFKDLICGGSIIGDHFVLTAAHCVHEKEKKYYIKVGDHSLRKKEDNEKIYVSDWQKLHPKFNRPFPYDNDVALVHTSERISYNDHVKPICLGRKNPFKYGDSAIVIGWGKLTAEGKSSIELQEVRVNLVSKYKCEEAYAVATGQFCAGYDRGEKDACQGDSGGALLVFDGTMRYVLIGMVSYGSGCGTAGASGVYVNTSHYIDWIESETRVA